MEYKDYYKTLGVERGASKADIKKAYRRLARKYHPDVSKEAHAEAKFKDISEAYNVLKNKEKRAAYDELGASWQAGQDFRTPPGWEQGHEANADGSGQTYYSSSGPAGTADFSDFFESLFGQTGGFPGGHPGAGMGGGSYDPYARGQTTGQDQHVSIQIELADAFHGTTRQLSLTEPVIGADGQLINKNRTLKVKIPKGIQQGQTMRLKGQGIAAPGSTARGDLFLAVNFAPHQAFNIDGKDIHLQLPVAPWEAVLGAKVEVSLPDGKSVNLNLPAGSNSGKRLRLKGKGIPATIPGDIFVTLNIVVPETSDDETKQAYEALQKSSKFKPRANMA